MIRGAIEVVSTEAVQGWIYCPQPAGASQTILAFSGKQCVGAGRANVYRPDLADAGLGDGNLGFQFPISIAPDLVQTIVVKFEGSDAVILQSGASVRNEGSYAAGLKREAVLGQMGRLKWALKHGRIGQTDFDFLRTLYSLGLYERGLVRRKAADDDVVADPWRVAARSLFEAFAALEVETTELKVDSAEVFKAELARVARSVELLPIVALHCETPVTLHVAEGSHVRGGGNSDAEAGPVSMAKYPLSPECLLILDSRLAVELVSGKGLEIVTAKAPMTD
jgi:hypothetical protein